MNPQDFISSLIIFPPFWLNNHIFHSVPKGRTTQQGPLFYCDNVKENCLGLVVFDRRVVVGKIAVGPSIWDLSGL